MKKRLMMTAVMLFSLLSSIGIWADTNGTIGDNITWILSDDGVLTISGTGEMPDYEYSTDSNTSPWYCNGSIKTIVIGEGITKIGRSSFYHCTSCKSIKLPSTLKTIGGYAFSECDFTSGIELPEGLETIESNGFSECTLGNITLPQSLKEIGHDAFFNALNLTSIIIPKGVMKIGTEAFFPGSMESITVEKGNTVYDSRNNCNAIIETASNTLVVGCNKTVIPDGIVKIEEAAFDRCNGTTNLVIPASVEIIGDFAFSDNHDLQSITLSKNLKSIGRYAFVRCSNLTEISIPSGVISIGDNTFLTCGNLSKINISCDTPPTLGNDAFKDIASDFSITIPWGAAYTYKNREKWKDFSNNYITLNAVYKTDGTAVKLFYSKPNECEDGWESMDLYNSYLMQIADPLAKRNILIKSTLTSVEFDESIKNFAYEDCSRFFNDLNALETIKGLEFVNTAQATSMKEMFKNCSSLKSLDLSTFNTKNVTNMDGMFSGCSSLNKIYVSDDFNTDNVTSSTSMFENSPLKSGNKDMANYIDGNFEKKVGTLDGEILSATGEDLTIQQDLSITDESDLKLTEAQLKIKSGNYSRIGITSKWGTLCLPFDIANDETCNAKFYTIKNINKDAITLEEVKDVTAGTPVIFCLTAEGSTVAYIPGKGTLTTTPGSSNSLVGTFTTQTVPDNAYFIAKDAFRKASDYKTDGKDVKVAAYRAYIQPTEGQSLSANTLRITMGDATGIDNAVFDAIDNGSAEYYDASGKRTDGLHKGLNIVKTGNKTRKIIIK